MTGRDHVSGKEDMRQRRSKRHLTDALLGLMEERPYREISVVDICQRAMVHRTTFYAHFADKDDLFRFALQDLMDRFSAGWARLDEEKGLRDGLCLEFRKVLEFFRVHRRFLTVGLGSSGGTELQMMENAIAEVLERFMLERTESAVWKETPDVIPVWSRFYAGAIMSTVSWWLKNEMTPPEEKMVELMERLLPENR